jgi:transglutaminase-like putative cysteine protease
LIFFILPRVSSSGYLRNLGIQSSIMTGFSQDVSLGGIGQIQQSSNVVMHIQVLDGKMPESPKWRGVALANFDGRRWYNTPETATVHGLYNSPLDLTHISNFSFYSAAQSVPHLPSLSYRVVMEPVGLNLFFLAPAPLKINGDYRLVEIRSDGSIYSNRLIENGAPGESDNPQSIGAYTAEADTRNPDPYVRDSVSRDYPPRVAVLYLQLPRLDPRIPQLARQISATAGSNYARAKAVERYLQTNFGYTLELPGLREADPLAHFLFERKKGHCEYFASSMAIMLRTLGIPARVVNGFRGGEYNDLTSSYIVREKDAHSWVEAYFPEYGWVTFDPTPAGPAAGPMTGWSRIALYMDAARQMWREWIVNYDFSHQARLRTEISTKTGNAQSSFRSWLWTKYRSLVTLTENWQRRLERLSPFQMAMCCVLVGFLVALPFMPKAWRRIQRRHMMRNPQRAPRTSASFWYMRMLKMMARRGARKEPSQTPEEFTASIADPLVRQHVERFTEHYERARFDESVEDAQKLPELFEEMAARK